MKIIKDIRNELLKRQEISVLVESGKNPGFEEMEKKVSEKLGKSEEIIDVYNIKGSFGSHEFKVDFYVYDSKEDLEKSVQKKKKKGSGKEVKVEEKKSDGKPKEKVSVEGGAPVEKKPEKEEKAVGETKRAEEAKEP